MPPLLVFGWGNPSRGDDALGPLFIERLTERAQGQVEAGQLECLTDFQLQVEHALDLVGRDRVLLVDSAVGLSTPFTIGPVRPVPGASFTTHALAPGALLQVFRDVQRAEPPPCTQLAIRAGRFELGEPPSAQALTDLEAALDWALQWVRASDGEPAAVGGAAA